MYQQPHFQEDDPLAIGALIRACPLGLLISGGAADLTANAIPILLDPAAGPQGTLRCHVARANSQWREIGKGADVLVVFQGAQHYVHPGWYETKRETGKVVPTWNYIMVQVRGRARAVEDGAWIGRQIRDLTDMMEGNYPKPWAVDDAPASFIEAQMRGIVGIEIAIASMTGKWKVSQNRSEADRKGVVQGLHSRQDDEADAMARLVAEKLAGQQKPPRG
jgi:transcriptional regulator